MKRDEIKSSSDMLLYKANIDLNSAKALMELFEKGEIEIDMEKIYFDVQQATEKALKSILSKYEVRYRRIHDIEELIAICEDNHIQLIKNIDILINLTDYAVEGRYDIVCDDIEDSSQYFDLAESLIEFVRQTIKS